MLPVLTNWVPPLLSLLLSRRTLLTSPHWLVLPSSELYDWNRTFTGLRLGSPHRREVLMELTRRALALAGDS